MKDVDYYAGRDIPVPARPVKPRHPARGEETADAFAQYAKDLRVYEEAMPAFMKNQTRYRATLNARLDECVEDLALENGISRAQADIVWHKAWEDGHSSGIQDVLYHFDELLDICEKFAKTT